MAGTADTIEILQAKGVAMAIAVPVCIVLLLCFRWWRGQSLTQANDLRLIGGMLVAMIISSIMLFPHDHGDSFGWSRPLQFALQLAVSALILLAAWALERTIERCKANASSGPGDGR